MELQGRIALVTGGTSGIGRETARQLKAAGARVAICGRHENTVHATARDLDVLGLVGDVGVEADARRLVESVHAEFGDFDALINNAGFGRFATLADTTVEDLEAVFRTNVTGALLMARESARIFTARGGGNIVNVASTAARKGFAGGSVYAASKFALSALTECWRAELRPHDVRVMQINPSEVQTSFAENAGFEARAHNPRKLQAPDVAQAIVSMLALPDRGFVTELTLFATNPDGPSS